MLNTLKWRPLAQRRVDIRLCALYKVVHGLVAIPMDTYIKLHRDGIHIQPIYSKTNYYAYSFFPRTVSDWNQLDVRILSATSLASFKSRVASVTHDLPYAP